jgi:hypothetical protein
MHHHWNGEASGKGVGEVVRGRANLHAAIGDSGFKIKVIRAIASPFGWYYPSVELSTKWLINSCFDNFKNLSRSLGNKITTYKMPLIAQNPKPRGKIMFYRFFRFSHP